MKVFFVDELTPKQNWKRFEKGHINIAGLFQDKKTVWHKRKTVKLLSTGFFITFSFHLVNILYIIYRSISILILALRTSKTSFKHRYSSSSFILEVFNISYILKNSLQI